jgi:nucleotide-binding universal stress UspA family protein
MQPIRTILAAHDFSEHAEAALEVAIDLARRLDAGLHLLHVVRPPSFDYVPGDHIGIPISALHLHQRAEQRLHRIVQDLPALPQRVGFHVLEGTIISASIDEYAAEIGADMIVMGTHGRSGLSHMLHGSVAERTLRHAPCPVLTVPLPSNARYAAEHPRPRMAPGLSW